MSKKTLQRSVAKRINEREVVFRIVETISYTQDLNVVLRAIIDVVDNVTSADEIFVYTLDSSHLQLRVSKKEKSISQIRLPLGEGLTGWVAEHQEMITISHKAYLDKRFVAFARLRADTYEAFGSFPLLYHARVIGVLNVQFRESHVWRKSEVRLIQMIATMIAGALEHARLAEESTQLKESLRARKMIEQAKGVLMKRYALSEDAAYGWLKARAMNMRKTIKEIAEAVLVSLG